MLPQVSPEEGVSVRLTVPVNPFRAEMVIVVVAEEPIVTAEGEADDMAKSATAYVTAVEWERVPLTPVIVARKLPDANPVQNRVDPPDPPLTMVGVTLHKRSDELVVTERETAPVKPFSDAMVIVDCALVPVVTAMFVGLAVMTKSCA
jgi:hypothetical protein